MNVKTIIAIGAAAAAAFYLVKKRLDKTKEVKTATVRQKSWSQDVKVERYEEKEGKGWSVPNGAYDVKVEQRIRYSSDAARAMRDVMYRTYDLDYPTRSARRYISDVMAATYQPYYTYKIKKWVEIDTVHFTGTDDAPAVSIDNAQRDAIMTQHNLTPFEGESDGAAPELGMGRTTLTRATRSILCTDGTTGEFVTFSKSFLFGKRSDADDAFDRVFSVLKTDSIVSYHRSFFGEPVLSGQALT